MSAQVKLDNSGKGSLLVPGFNDVPIDYELEPEDRFAHGITDWEQNPAITARELAMTAVMNEITDKATWSTLIDNDQIVASWKQEAFTRYELMSDRAWDWCVRELRDKAEEYRRKQFVRVLDTGSSVCKSDTLLDESVAWALRQAFADSFSALGPGQGERSVIDPNMYPLVYGKTKVAKDSYVRLPLLGCDFDSMFLSEEQCVLSPVHVSRYQHSLTVDGENTDTGYDYCDVKAADRSINERHQYRRKGLSNYDDIRLCSEAFLHSMRYQCLPFDVEFANNSEARIVSYINGIHPSKRSAYGAIESIITASVQMWNEGLIKARWSYDDPRGRDGPDGRYPQRIKTFGVEWENLLPLWARVFCESHIRHVESYQNVPEHLQTLSSIPPDIVKGRYSDPLDIVNDEETVPPSKSRLNETAPLRTAVPLPAPSEADWEALDAYLGRRMERHARPFHEIEDMLNAEARKRKRWRHPEPGTAFTYDDWKNGRNTTRAIVEKVPCPLNWQECKSWRPSLKRYGSIQESEHIPYEVHIQETFKDLGLQIIPKVSEISLQSGKTYSTDWRLPGHLNEHIVAVAVFSFDCSNVRSNISICQETSIDKATRYFHDFKHPGRCMRYDSTTYEFDCRGGAEEIQALGEIYGLKLDEVHWDFGDGFPWSDTLPVQYTGSVELRQGRLITFPNVLEYSLNAELVDKTAPGHTRCIFLHLVDPHYRICSTGNVPPQQMDWWQRAVRPILVHKLPTELVWHILSYCDSGMSKTQAQKHRETMEQEERYVMMGRHAHMTDWFHGG